MRSISGNVQVNGLSDSELGQVWRIKAKHEDSLSFTANQLQPLPRQSGEQFYNNAIFAWSNEDGLEAVREVINLILKKEEGHERKTPHPEAAVTQ